MSERAPSLAIVAQGGLISIQGPPRPGRMHEGVPPGGAAVYTKLVAANREAANRDDAFAIESFGIVVVRAETRIEVATPDGAKLLEPGEEYRLSSKGWTYLAVRGGIAEPRTLVTTQLRSGARIESAGEPPVRFMRPPMPSEGPVRMIPGPDLDAFEPHALDALCAAPYRVAMPHRVGAHLGGAAPIPRRAGYRERTRPMVRGAIEIARDGHVIVLGPDHPTTGGYPILGVVAAEDVERVFALPSVQFVRYDGRG